MLTEKELELKTLIKDDKAFTALLKKIKDETLSSLATYSEILGQYINKIKQGFF